MSYTPDCADCPTPAECRAKNDCQVIRQIRHGNEGRPPPPFPILRTGRTPPPGAPTSVPWAFIAPHEAQAQRNHCGQTLKRLAERGGLSPCEMLAVIEGREWVAMGNAQAEAQLRDALDSWSH